MLAQIRSELLKLATFRATWWFGLATTVLVVHAGARARSGARGPGGVRHRRRERLGRPAPPRRHHLSRPGTRRWPTGQLGSADRSADPSAPPLARSAADPLVGSADGGSPVGNTSSWTFTGTASVTGASGPCRSACRSR
jgi:hypothetical protein